MARFNTWCPELAAALAEPFPAEAIERKKAGKGTVPFVSWHYYVYRLNSLVGPEGWSQDPPVMMAVGGKLVMAVPVTILGVRKVNVGSEQEEHGTAQEVDDGQGGTRKVVKDFGSAETNAYAQALKRTLALFGMGLSHYDGTGEARLMVEKEEGREMGRLLAYLRKVGARLEEGALGIIGGDQVELVPALRGRWGAIRSDAVLAHAYVREVEKVTGISMAEFVAQHRAAGGGNGGGE